MIIQFIINGLIIGAIYSLIALGFSIIYKTVRFFHLAHGIVYTSSAYIFYLFWISLGFNKTLSIFISLLATGILGVIIDRLIYLNLRKNHSSNLIFLIVSFGVFIILQNLIQIIFGTRILTIRTGPLKEGNHFLGAVITDTQIMIVLVCLFLFLFSWLLINKTKLGKTIRAVADNTEGAKTVGINPEKVIMSVFFIGSVLAGVAGILISLETNIEPTMGFDAILKGIIASIIGGIGSISGALFGGLFLGLAENIGVWQIQASWKDAIALGILILFLLLKPSGIIGVKTEKEQL